MGDKDLIRLDEQLCFMLYAGSRAMTKAYQPMLKILDLTYPQYLVMMVLWEWGAESPVESTVKALGERLHLDSGTLTPLLKRLEQQGLVSRARDADDERRVLIAATAHGLELESKALAWVQGGRDGLSGAGIDVERMRADLSSLLGLLTKAGGR